MNETQVSKTVFGHLSRDMYSSVTVQQLLKLSEKYPKRLFVPNRERRQEMFTYGVVIRN